jgi:C4-dicarboxylate-specific signal transduction histidine kinase
MEQPWMEAGRLAEVGLMSAMLVHEIRQPLFAIKALVQILACSPSETGREQVDRQLVLVLEEVAQLEEVLDRYGTLSRRADTRWEPLDLHDVVRFAADTVSHRATRHGIQVAVSLDASSPVLKGDAVGLRQVLVNILQNAIDATTGRAAGLVELCTRDAGPFLEVLIRDNGCGMAGIDASRVFEPFFTTKPPGRGTGLGLSIAREIVRHHGGCIALDPEPGATVFVIRLPRMPTA